MTDKTTLSELGTRICIIGPSNSGKSTLAQALSRKLSITHLHLDQIAHKPYTNWEKRPNEEFVADIDEFLAKNENWVIDGNYSICIPQRFERATSVIWLDSSRWKRLWRYLLRCFENNPHRPGKLNGSENEFSWGLVFYTFFQYPKKMPKYWELLNKHKHKPILIRSFKELSTYYDFWNLEKPK